MREVIQKFKKVNTGKNEIANETRETQKKNTENVRYEV